MMNNIQERIKAERIKAMKSGDKSRRDAITLIIAQFTQTEVDTRKSITDADAIGLLAKMKKNRQESIRLYEAGGAPDKAAIEEYEILIIDEFLPKQLDESEILSIIESAIASTNATTIKEMGKVLGILKAELHGKADMASVSKLVKEKLS